MATNETRNKILLALYKTYMEGKGRYIGFENQTKEEKEIVAELKAKGFVEVQGSSTVRFTDKGYSQWGDYIKALNI